MKEITLKGEIRTTNRKSDIKNLRNEGKVPCIFYGQGVENVMFAVEAKELKNITHTPASYIINLEINGASYKSTFHQIQYHPVTDEAMHVDFLAVIPGRPVTIDIPVDIFGNSEGVKQGGKLMVSARKLRVCGALENLPDTLPVDITELKLGKQISAGDLSYDGIQIVSPKGTVVCAVKMTRAALGAAAAAAAKK